jgi:hypothetical protein
MSRPCNHTQHTDGCRICYWCLHPSDKGKQYRQTWGEPEPESPHSAGIGIDPRIVVFNPIKEISTPLNDVSIPCIHRGKQTRLQLCATCNGRVQVRVFACSIHQECTMVKRVDNLAVCQTCKDYQPTTITDPTSTQTSHENTP